MKLRLLILLSFCFGQCFSQDYRSYRKVLNELRSFEKKDSLKIQPKVESWWQQRREAGQIPLVVGDSVTFLYRGNASSVVWNGDFNSSKSSTFNNKGKRIRNTSIWVLNASFPRTARLDYKIVLNGKDWILDPENPNEQFAGIAGGIPNSELRMPEWRRDPAQIERPTVPKGVLKTESIQSSSMGYEIRYTVYTPAGSSPNDNLPVFYVTDGSEYLDARMGNMPLVLDNLIAIKKVTPIKVVLVDPRDPANASNNRRMQELVLNEKYLMFFYNELIPTVEGPNWKSSTSRGIMGTSLGGLNAAYFSFKLPDVFPRCGIQSPAFWYKQEIFDMATANTAKIKVSMTAGTINDTSTEARKMKEILDQQGSTCSYVEVSEGHSWGNWRNLLDDILVDLYPAAVIR